MGESGDGRKRQSFNESVPVAKENLVIIKRPFLPVIIEDAFALLLLGQERKHDARPPGGQSPEEHAEFVHACLYSMIFLD